MRDHRGRVSSSFLIVKFIPTDVDGLDRQLGDDSKISGVSRESWYFIRVREARCARRVIENCSINNGEKKH